MVEANEEISAFLSVYAAETVYATDKNKSAEGLDITDAVCYTGHINEKER